MLLSAIIVIDDTVLAHAIEQLFGHRASAIHIKGFYPKEAASELAKKLIADQDRLKEWLVASPGKGLESADVKTHGLQPYSMVAASKDPKAQSDYFDGAIACMREFRHMKPMPILGPLDKLRLELDEIWPNGATVTKNREVSPA